MNAGGSTHNAMEDIALMKALVNMTVLSIGDPNMIATLMRHSMTYEHPVYLRIGKGKADRMLYDPATTDTPIGTGLVARDGGAATIFAHGEIVWQALQAADELAADGIDVRVIDMYTIKPLDIESVVRAAETTGAVVAAENHNVIGALGSAVAEALSENCPVPLERVGVMDRFGEVGPQEYLMDIFHLTAGDIVEKAKRAIERKR